MPELPEVETVVRTLNQLVGGKRIQRVEVLLNRIIQRPADPVHFTGALQDQMIHRIERRGKFIRFIMDEIVMVSHLRMEGRYGLYAADEPMEKHTHVVFYFTDGTQLRYKDVRQFGTMHLFASGDELIMPPLHKLGLEPLDESFSFEAFHTAIVHRSTKIKPLLLNQEIIVGLGNIYVDESLFKSGIFAERQANTLSLAELQGLHQAIVETLQGAVEAGGSSIKSYVNGQGEMGMFQQQLQVYGRKGMPCEQCGSLIEKIVVGGRGTHYCPSCQPKEPKL
jgi:formamidopyrimidine-DNA glycosylase